MSRDNSTYKETFNRALDHVRSTGVGAELPTETDLAGILGASRTTVRSVLSHLDEQGVISWTGRQKTILRTPTQKNYFSIEETTSTSERVETKFMESILGRDLKPGTVLREADLVREFGASTSVVREMLIRFSRFGLIEKEPNRAWVLRGFTREFADEVFDVREMFETRAFEAFLHDGPDSLHRKTLLSLAQEHHRIVNEIDTAYLDFPRLDEQFHRVWIDRQGNRFVQDFFGLVSVIFHFHYRWNKKDERDRNLSAALQHLAVIDALADGDLDRARARFLDHLTVARVTLSTSVQWD